VTMALRFTILLLAVVAAVAVPVPYKNCGSPSDIIKIDKIDASVWPVTRGKAETISIRLIVGQIIRGGTYEFKLTFDGLPLIDKKGNLKELNITLPIPAGPFVKNVTITVPTFIPPGTASAHMVLKDDSGKQAICVNVDVPFKLEEGALPSQEFSLVDTEPFSVGVPIPIKNCGKTGDKFTITRADASIWPPKVGQPISLQLNGTLSQDISGGNYEAKVKFLGIPIIDQKGTIADLAKKLNLTLPIRAGKYGLWQTVTVPAVVPKGDIEVWVQAFNQNAAEIACIDVQAHLSLE